jgi:hypothetical protein
MLQELKICRIVLYASVECNTSIWLTVITLTLYDIKEYQQRQGV